MKRKNKRIVITGGHLTPALAVIDELLRRGSWEIIFFGRKHTAEGDQTPSVESQLVAERNLTFVPLSAGRWQRRLTRYTPLAFLKIPFGFFQAFYFLLRLRPQVILSFGGYLGVPVVMAGWLLGIPSVAHEQTLVLGLGSKINLPLVKKLAVSWPQTIKGRWPSKLILTGNPLRKEIFKANQEIWQVLDFTEKLPLVFITGGNQGSHMINEVVREVIPQLVKKANVFHQCGHLRARGDFEELEGAREKLPPSLKPRYHVKKYLLAEEMGTLLNRADLVVSRSGANTVTELAALGKVAILIPLPWSAVGEQTKNAQLLVRVGTAEILPQEGLTEESLLELVEKMLANLERYQKKAPLAKKLVKPDAAPRLVDLIEEIVK